MKKASWWVGILSVMLILSFYGAGSVAQTSDASAQNAQADNADGVKKPVKRTAKERAALREVGKGESRAAMRQRQNRLEASMRVVGAGDSAGDAEVFGNLIYEPGAPADFFRTDTGGGNQIVGNRFNSGSGISLLADATLTQISIHAYQTDGNIFFSILGSISGSSAIPFAGVTGMSPVNGYFLQFYGFNISPGSDFLIGQYVGTYLGPDSVGMRSASVNSQGFHGMQINFVNSAVATGLTSLPGQNAMVRTQGDVLVPVELMNFTIE